jgi:hypothetical protein
MSMGIRKAVGATMLLAMAALVLTACGSGSETTTRTVAPVVSRETADHLAKLSDRVASDLDAGDTCNAARAADDLNSAVQESDLPANLRPEVDAVTSDLVDQVNCPPPPPQSAPALEKPKKPKKPPGSDEHGNGNGHENGGHNDNGHSSHGGFVPPGHAKLQGEQG